MADEKTVYLNRVVQEVADGSRFTSIEVANAMLPGTIPRILFDQMYEVIESIRTQQLEAEQRAEAAERRQGIADLRAQEFFVRLRDAGQLKEGERY